MGMNSSCLATRDKEQENGERTIVERQPRQYDEMQQYVHQHSASPIIIALGNNEIQVIAPQNYHSFRTTLTMSDNILATQMILNNSHNHSLSNSALMSPKNNADSNQKQFVFNGRQSLSNQQRRDQRDPQQLQGEELKQNLENLQKNDINAFSVPFSSPSTGRQELTTDRQNISEREQEQFMKTQIYQPQMEEYKSDNQLGVPQSQKQRFGQSPSLKDMKQITENLRQRGGKAQTQFKQKIDFAFLFASPIVFKYFNKKINGTLDYKDGIEHGLGEISYKDEFKFILEGMKESRTNIKYMNRLATEESLIDVFKYSAQGLHFSGHGLENKWEKGTQQFPEMTQSQYKDMLQDKGDVLLFEEETAQGAQWFCSEKDLENLLKSKYEKIKFVVVASCHSERCGRIFLNTVADHVICVEQSKLLNDKAACTFSKRFYNIIFSNHRYNIREAYEEAKMKVETEFGSKESVKLLFLTQEGHVCDENCKVFTDLDFGTPQNFQKDPTLMILPPAVKEWIPRNKEMYDIIEKLTSDVKILEIFGVSGVGKSAMISKVLHFIADRGIYKGGIIYSNFSQMSQLRDALLQLAQRIDLCLRGTNKKTEVVNKLDKSQILYKIHEFADKDQQVLFIFDNVDDLIIKSKQDFIDLLYFFIEGRDNLQIIFTTSKHLDLKNFALTNLQRLDNKKAKELFMSKLPSKEAKAKVQNSKQIQELLEITNKNIQQINHIVKQPTQIPKMVLCKVPCTKNHKDCTEQFYNIHPMFKILNIPLYICMAASQIHQNSIAQVFNSLLQAKDQDESAFYAIDSTIQSISGEYDYGVDILMLIGQTVNGLSYLDIQDLFRDKDGDEIKKILEMMTQSSLLTKEPVDMDNYNYILQNFCSNYVHLKLEEDRKNKIKYNRMLATYYCNYLINLKIVFDQDKIDLEDLQNTINAKEKNIIHCVKYLIEQKWGKLKLAIFDGENLKEQIQANRILQRDWTRRGNKKQNTEILEQAEPQDPKIIGLGGATSFQTQISVSSPSSQVNRAMSTASGPKKTRLGNEDFTEQRNSLKINTQKAGGIERKGTKMIKKDKKKESNKTLLVVQQLAANERNDTWQESDLEDISDEEEKSASESYHKITEQEHDNNPLNLQSQDSNQSKSDQSEAGHLAEKMFGAYKIKIKNMIDEVKEEEKQQYDDTINKFSNLFKNMVQKQAVKPHQSVEKTIQQEAMFTKKITRRFNNKEPEQQQQQPPLLQISNAHPSITIGTLSANPPAQTNNLLIPIKGNRNPQPPPQQPQAQIQRVDSVDDEVDSEAIVLLYHFLSLLAVRKDSAQTFDDILELFQVLEEDIIFKANLMMLQIYQAIIQGYHQTALENIVILQQLFTKADSKLGLAIANFFFAYESWHHYRQKIVININEIYEKLNEAIETFDVFQDEDAKQHCITLRTSMDQTLKQLYKQDTSGSQLPKKDKSNNDKKKGFAKNRKKVGTIQLDNNIRIKLDREKDHLNLLLNPIDFDKQVFN